MHTSSRGRYLEIFLFSLGSVILTRLGLAIMFFLIPLQMVRVRRGRGAFSIACAIVLVLLAGAAYYDYAWGGDGSASSGWLIVLNFSVAFLLLLGLGIANARPLERLRGLFRLLAAVGVIGLIIVPAAVLFPRIPSFSDMVTEFFTFLAGVLRDIMAPAGTPAPGSEIARLLDPAYLKAIFGLTLARGFLLGIFVLLLIGFWGGTFAAARTVRFGQAAVPIARLADFRMDFFFIWVFIGCGAVVLADSLSPLPVISEASYAGWNVGLVVLFLYGLQGLGIVRFAFEKYRLPRLLWAIFLAAVLIALVAVQTIQIFLLALPALGIAENWVRLRVPHRPEPES